jgi:hemerythrin
MRLAWSADQMIGIDRIDAEHARLVEEMNALSQALCADHGHAALEHRMRQMAGLLEHHFATEEAHMLAHPYSGAAEHRAEHQRVMEVVQGLTAHVSSESVALGIRFLYDWLLRHIRTYDRELPRGTVDETRRDVGPG